MLVVVERLVQKLGNDVRAQQLNFLEAQGAGHGEVSALRGAPLLAHPVSKGHR